MPSLKAFSALVAVAGICTSLYALNVEKQKELDPSYEAMCDISEHMSCSKVLTSEYSRGFGFLEKYLGEDSPLVLPNSIYGVIFYSTMLLLSLVGGYYASLLQYILSIVSVLGSVYLAYILYILNDFCIVCVTTYALNLMLLVASYVKFNRAKGKKVEKPGRGSRQRSKKQA